MSARRKKAARKRAHARRSFGRVCERVGARGGARSRLVRVARGACAYVGVNTGRTRYPFSVLCHTHRRARERPDASVWVRARVHRRKENTCRAFTGAASKASGFTARINSGSMLARGNSMEIRKRAASSVPPSRLIIN